MPMFSAPDAVPEDDVTSPMVRINSIQNPAMWEWPTAG